MHYPRAGCERYLPVLRLCVYLYLDSPELHSFPTRRASALHILIQSHRHTRKQPQPHTRRPPQLQTNKQPQPQTNKETQPLTKQATTRHTEYRHLPQKKNGRVDVCNRITVGSEGNRPLTTNNTGNPPDVEVVLYRLAACSNKLLARQC